MAKPIATAGTDVLTNYTTATTSPFFSTSFTGSGTPGTGGTTITGYHWYIVAQPATSNSADKAVWSSPITGTNGFEANTQAATIQNIKNPGTYRCMLVVTDDTGADSETDPLLAPSSAFVHIRVPTQNATLIKPAMGERNWTYSLDNWADQIDVNTGNISSQTIISHSDVSAATGADLDVLVSNAKCTDPAVPANGDLHKHSGDAVDAATTSENGVVRLWETPASAAAPKVWENDYAQWSAFVSGTYSSGTYTAGRVQNTESETPNSKALCAFQVNGKYAVTKFTCFMADAGGTAGNPYQFKLYAMTQAEYEANNVYDSSHLIGTATFTLNTVANSCAMKEVSVSSTTASTDMVLAVTCSDAPTAKGGGLTVTVHGYKTE